MIRLARKASLLIALSLLASTATAHAECAECTEVWQITVREGPNGPWMSRPGTYVAQKECEEALARRALRYGPAVPGYPAVMGYPGRCEQVRRLPDTVDPRGVK
jgi:hypothetical protein